MLSLVKAEGMKLETEFIKVAFCYVDYNGGKVLDTIFILEPH